MEESSTVGVIEACDARQEVGYGIMATSCIYTTLRGADVEKRNQE